MDAFRSFCLVTTGVLGLSLTARAASPAAIEALSRLHHSNEMEIDMGRQAQEKGNAEDVRAYGKMLVEDHTAADASVQKLVKRESAALHPPQAKDAKEAADMKTAMEAERKLDSLEGAAFDNFFVEMMKKDHRHDVREVEGAITDLKGTATGDLLAQVLPVLRKHLAQAEALSTIHKIAR